MDSKQFYTACTHEGLEAVLSALGPNENLWALADECAADAQQAKEGGDAVKAACLLVAEERLRCLQQYRRYEEFPYD